MATGVGVEGAPSYEQVEHELKTPLTSIRSFAEILLDCPELSAEERQRFLLLLAGENDRMLAAVERLLGLPELRAALS